MPITLVPFYMIRHGETTANAEKFFSGTMDVPLTENGHWQAEKARAVVNLLDKRPKTIVHSHLSRARDTARIINYDMQLPMYETPLIGEQHYGDWQGQPHALIRPKVSNNDAPPNGETIDEFKERAKEGINFSLTYNDPVLLVCHGGVFRAFRKLYEQDDMAAIENCKLYYFEPDATQKDFPWKITIIE